MQQSAINTRIPVVETTAIDKSIMKKQSQLKEMIGHVKVKSDKYRREIHYDSVHHEQAAEAKYGTGSFKVNYGENGDPAQLLKEIDDDTEHALKLIALEAARIDGLSWDYRRERSMGARYDKARVTEQDIQNVKLRDDLQLFFNKSYKLVPGEITVTQKPQVTEQERMKAVVSTEILKKPAPPEGMKKPAGYKTPQAPPKTLIKERKITVTAQNNMAMKEFNRIAKETSEVKVELKEREPYIPMKGDKIDEIFSKVLNESGLDLNIQRISEGVYLLGSKQIFLKIINGNLLVRVGGGFMKAEQFIKQFGLTEMMRMKAK